MTICMLTLNEIKAGQTVRIQEIRDADVAMQALRMGIIPGAVVLCVAKVPAGPAVIVYGGMELALGHHLCEQITVEFA